MEAKPKRTRAPKPRTQPLRRGGACLNCRHLKIRCDGIRPVCGKCERVPKNDPCQFLDSTPRMLRRRPNDGNLAGPSESPFLAGAVEVHGYGSPNVEFSSPASLFSNLSLGSDTHSQSETVSDNSFVDFGIQEPPSETIEVLLHYFLAHGVELGFFLDPERFRAAVMLPQIPLSDILRPARSLLYAAYLWGARISQEDALVKLEPVFLRHALRCVATESCVEGDVGHTVHTIQTHVLLSRYLLMQRRVLGAQLHADNAAILALGYGMHLLGSAQSPSTLSKSRSPLCDVRLWPVQDAVEAGERVRGFWAVVCLQTSLALAVDCPGTSSLGSSILESAWTEIETPWPMPIADYETQNLPGAQGGEVLMRFLMNEAECLPGPASHTQASVLLHRASLLAAKLASNLQHAEVSSYMACYTWLDRRISRFGQALPPTYPSEPMDGDLVLAHTLTAAAAITLHRAFSAVEPASQDKCLRAARAVLQNSIPEAGVASPVVGTVCAMACGVLLDEIQRAGEMRSEWARVLEIEIDIDVAAAEEEHALLVDLQTGIATLRAQAIGTPLAEYQLREIEQRYSSLYTCS
ncbi:hypothetical protein DFH09DRAFT_1197206 [Mycena vulgaris]|nr:hypothetical protein DFH09DRAFT_1197206 [Mycena vulgaris]